MNLVEKKYTFSIIVPYYNTKIDQTETCIKSLLVQDLNLLKEIIVVNDGSNEENTNNLIFLVNELNKIQMFDEEKSLIKLIHQENLGLAAARKTGFNNSTGEIIMFVDSDDWILDSNWINKLNKYFLENPKIDLISFNSLHLENEKIKIPSINLFTKIKKLTFEETLISENKIAVWSYAYKKSILKDEPFFNALKLRSEDLYFNAYLLSKEYTILQTNEIFHAYRINNEGSICWNSKNYSAKDEIKIAHEWFTNFKNWNIFNSYLARNYWIYFCINKTLNNFYGFRKMKKWAIKEKINYPTIKEIKSFLKQFSPYKGLTKIYIWCCLNIIICDLFLPIISTFYLKIKYNNEYF